MKPIGHRRVLAASAMCVSAAVLQMLGEGGEGLLAYVVLHAFGIRMGGCGWNSKRAEKISDQLVPVPRFLREFPASVGEENGTVRQSGDQPQPAQTLNRAVDCDVRNPKTAGQVGHPSLPGGGNELRDHLHVILRRFLGIFCPGALKTDLVRSGSVIG